MTTSEIATVLAWHDALNARDFDTLVQVSSDDIEFGDANGAGQGHEALREWASSLGVTAADAGPDVRTATVWWSSRETGRRHARRRSGWCAIMSPRCSGTTTCASALAATELTEEDLAG